MSLANKQGLYLQYYNNRILAQGITPSYYSSTGYASVATYLKPWVLNHPGERALQIWASALWFKNTYGVSMNYAVIANEPQAPLTTAILSEDIKALAPRFAWHGLSMKSQFPEAVTPQTAWNGFITPLQTDTDMWNNVGRVSYHNYGTADPYRSYIKNFAATMGIRTGQTEMNVPNFDDLYNDLTLGGVSYWEVGYSANSTLVPNNGFTTFTPSSYYIRVRQVLHYVRPGATRVSAIPNDTMLTVLSFVKSGAVTTIIDNKNAAAKTVVITGLPAGTYGLSKATAGATFFTESGVQTVGAGGTISVTAPGGASITTLYPRSAGNLPPTIMTWTTNPGYVVSPANTATISVAASDPEAGPLTYTWTVFAKPAGSNPIIATPTATTSSVSGLTVPGLYSFNIAVSDGANISNKKVYLTVYGTAPGPVLGSAGFRIAAPYGLVFGNPGDTTHANVELPTSAATVQVGISELANTDFTGRGTWTIVSQPTGGVATISATTYIFVSIRANVTGMTVPGTYVFQCNVTWPGHPDLIQRVICTVHPASMPPVINSITPSPLSPTLPVNTSTLTAVTSDPESDLLRHWWVVKSAPAGAKPTFTHGGRAITDVTGMNVPGSYTFTLRCFDDLHEVTRDVTLTVNPDPNPAGVKNMSGNTALTVYPNPTHKELNIVLADGNAKVSSLTISNMLGQVMNGLSWKADNTGNIRVNVQSLPVGNYMLSVSIGGKIVAQMVTKD